jgi:protein TonB
LSRIKYSNAVSSNNYISEQYVADFTSKIEKVGALNFPKMAQKKNFRLTMDIGIKADGRLYSIRIRKSSGNPAVDEAAKKIVHMSAPFPPLPKALLKELNVLVITRVWSFSDESGMTVK